MEDLTLDNFIPANEDHFHLADERLTDARTEGASCLNQARDFIRRFCVLPDDHCLTAITLWAAHTHSIQCFHTTPRLVLNSPEPGCGKTRILEVLDLLVADAMMSINISPAALFRTLADRPVTLLFDEVDAVWTRRGNHEELRAVLNAGYKRGAVIPRCVGPAHDVARYPVFCAAALAGIGDVPSTILTRSVVIKMRPRALDESVEPYRPRIHESEGRALHDRLSIWAARARSEIGAEAPRMPRGVEDRPAEVWEPLLAVADAAGSEWGRRARRACVSLTRSSQDRQQSLGVRLLSDIRIIFGDAKALHSEVIVERLREAAGLDDDAPWRTLYGKGIDKLYLASLLARYGVKPTKVTVKGRSLQGYRRVCLWESWIRYLRTGPSDSRTPEFPEFPESLPYDSAQAAPDPLRDQASSLALEPTATGSAYSGNSGAAAVTECACHAGPGHLDRNLGENPCLADSTATPAPEDGQSG